VLPVGPAGIELIAFSISTITFFEIELSIVQPTAIVFAVVPSCARRIVNVSPTFAVTRMISEFVSVGF
jgi:hypothetical protein